MENKFKYFQESCVYDFSANLLGSSETIQFLCDKPIVGKFVLISQNRINGILKIREFRIYGHILKKSTPFSK